MREVKRIVEQYGKLKDEHRFAIATIIDIEGSSYRRIGTKMLIADNGNWWGGISGGCLEGDVLRKALNSMNSGVPRVIEYDTREDDPHEIGIGLGCNGLIKILINPRNVDSTIQFLKSTLSTRKDSYYILSVDSNISGIQAGDILSIDDFMSSPMLKDKVDVEQLKKARSPQLVEVAEHIFFFQYHRPLLHIIIFGSNYDAIITAKLAAEIGYNTTLVAPKRFIDKPSFKVADTILPFENKLESIDGECAIILMNHDLVKDKKALELYIDSPSFYIGLLGPKTRGEKLTSTYTMQETKNVFFPAGLDIGATSPEEISLSILAEIKAVYSNRNGSHLRDRVQPIYTNSEN